MRLTIVAACGVLLAGCGGQSATKNAAEAPAAGEAKVSEPMPAQNKAEVATSAVTAAKVSPCLIQDGEELRLTPVRAIGTEPFWGAQVEGRCVTYSTPEDQKGTRIWTRFNPGPDGGVWVGTFEGKPFKLVTRLRQGCSDGMSDRSYPLDAILVVRGEERNGCAAPVGAGKR